MKFNFSLSLTLEANSMRLLVVLARIRFDFKAILDLSNKFQIQSTSKVPKRVWIR